jgi:hypothetical protein
VEGKLRRGGAKRAKKWTKCAKEAKGAKGGSEGSEGEGQGMGRERSGGEEEWKKGRRGRAEWR